MLNSDVGRQARQGGALALRQLLLEVALALLRVHGGRRTGPSGHFVGRHQEGRCRGFILCVARLWLHWASKSRLLLLLLLVVVVVVVVVAMVLLFVRLVHTLHFLLHGER